MKTMIRSIITIVIVGIGAYAVRADNLFWSPGGGGTWDTTTANWTGDDTLYSDAGVDTVNFTNSAGGLISLNVNHNPTGVVVSATSGTYTFTNASITGGGSLTKSGAGILELRAPNTFSGGINLSGGEIDVNNLNALGGQTFGGSVNLLHFTANSTLTINNSTPGASGGYTYDPMLIDAGVTAMLNRKGTAIYPYFFGNISGDGAVTVLSTLGNYIYLGGSNTFKGNLTATGNVGANADMNLGVTNNITILNGGALYLSLFAGISTYSASRTLQVNSGTIGAGNGAVWNGLVTGNGFTVGGSIALPPLLLANSNNSFVGPVVINTGWLEVNSPGALNGNTVYIQNNNSAGLRISGTPSGTFNNPLILSSAGVSYLDVSNANAVVNWSGTLSAVSSQILAKLGAGTLKLQTASPSFTGALDVRGGSLRVNFASANLASVTVSNGASLGGSGTVNITGGGAIKGDGSIDPGNSPGILTAAAVDPISGSGTLDFNFEFTKLDSPDYTNAAASSNDVLRLTGASPFSGDTMTLGNVIGVYIPGNLIAGTNNFRGGFYTDTGDFLSSFGGATFRYYAQKTGGPFTYNGTQYDWMTNVYPGAVMNVTTVNETGTQFGGVNGFVTEFIGLGIPEPTSVVLAVLGGLAFLRRRGK